MQILMFIPAFQMQKRLKIVAINEVQCLVRYNVHFSVWTEITVCNYSSYADNGDRLLSQTHQTVTTVTIQ